MINFIDIALAMKFEWMIAFIIFILLFLKVRSDNPSLLLVSRISQGLLLLTVLLGFLPVTEAEVFNHMFRNNGLLQFQKMILTIGLLIILAFSDSWLKRCQHTVEFILLLLSSLLGMFFMISSGHLLMFYLGLELSTIPLAAAANFDLERRKSSEGAMKLILSSSFSSAFLLFGISLIYGSCGSLVFSEISRAIVYYPLGLLGFILLFTGFAFKISAVPFHFWTADVYEGSPFPVTAFLSVVSKSAVSFIFLTVLYQVFQSMADAWLLSITILSFLSIGVGNLFALRQTNIKRLLAFSAIAQVGYILLAMLGGTSEAAGSVNYFLLIYMFSNLAAFGVAGMISSKTGREDISDYKGLYKSNRFYTWVMSVALFSLAGVPPTAGFTGKFFLILSGASSGGYALVIFAAFNMILSFYYYLRIVRFMFMDETENPIEPIEHGGIQGAALWICLAGTVILGFVGPVYEYIIQLTRTF